MYDAANQRVSGVRNDLRIKEIELKPRESGAFFVSVKDVQSDFAACEKPLMLSDKRA